MKFVDYSDTTTVPLIADSAQVVAPMKPLRRQRLLIVSLLCLSLCVGFLIWNHVVTTIPEFNQYGLLRSYQKGVDEQDSVRHASESSRTVLLWNSFFGDKRWSLPADTLGPDQLRDEFHCPEYRCEVTNNRDFLPEIDMFDAILFHTAEPFPFLQPVPKRRHPRQRYVFALMESPGETKHILDDEVGFYNLTMTYRLDSDIMWPYSYIFDVETGATVAPAKYPAWRKPPTEWNDTGVWQLWPEKTKMAAWFVSHCETLSRREQLVAALQQHIEVDVYGKCGTMSCERGSKDCDTLLDRKYKFYMSLENSLCEDYVSEKLFNVLKSNIIPVVYGGANYSQFLPPRSYINAEDFDNVQALAAYLEYLATHPLEYMRYFWWRRYYRMGYISPFCELCEKLHGASHEEKTQTYQDIKQWWMAGQCRFEAKIEF